MPCDGLWGLDRDEFAVTDPGHRGLSYHRSGDQGRAEHSSHPESLSCWTGRNSPGITGRVVSKSAGNDIEASEPRVTFESNLFDNEKSRNLSLVFTFGLTFRKKQKGKKK